MAHNWKPGDVALMPFGGRHCRAILDEDGTWMVVGRTNSANYGGGRPLVTIDPESPEDTERHWRVAGQSLASYRRALSEFANPQPPRPEEPKGLGAVVEAINDNHFVRVGSAGWVHVDDHGGNACNWEDIAAVRVLSEGLS